MSKAGLTDCMGWHQKERPESPHRHREGRGPGMKGFYKVKITVHVIVIKDQDVHLPQSWDGKPHAEKMFG